MHKRLIMLALTTSSLLVATSAHAQTNTVRNEQRTWAETRAMLNADLSEVTEDVTLTAASINNSFSAELGGGSYVRNFQDSWRNATATLNMDATNTLGSLNATAAAMGNSASMDIDGTIRGGNERSTVENTQFTHWGVFTANLNLDGENVQADSAQDTAITATAAAIANSLSVAVQGDLTVRGANENVGTLYSCDPAQPAVCEPGLGNIDQVHAVGGFNNWTANSRQFFRGDSRSNLNADLDNVVGAVQLTSAALGNSASFDVTNAEKVSVNNWQFAGYDPTARSEIQLGNVEGDVTSTTAAISNSFSISTLPETAQVNVFNQQLNRAYDEATANIALGNVTGSVSATVAAIGNSASVTNLVH